MNGDAGIDLFIGSNLYMKTKKRIRFSRKVYVIDEQKLFKMIRDNFFFPGVSISSSTIIICRAKTKKLDLLTV